MIYYSVAKKTSPLRGSAAPNGGPDDPLPCSWRHLMEKLPTQVNGWMEEVPTLIETFFFGKHR
jgi:hypothetical protein